MVAGSVAVEAHSVEDASAGAAMAPGGLWVGVKADWVAVRRR